MATLPSATLCATWRVCCYTTSPRTPRSHCTQTSLGKVRARHLEAGGVRDSHRELDPSPRCQRCLGTFLWVVCKQMESCYLNVGQGCARVADSPLPAVWLAWGPHTPPMNPWPGGARRSHLLARLGFTGWGCGPQNSLS